MSPDQPRNGRIIVAGFIVWYPLAGVAYQFLHYLLGLRRLGYDVYYVEDSARLVYDPVRNEFTEDASGNIAAVMPMLDKYGFEGKWAFRGNYPGGKCYGMSESQILQLYRDADAMLNVTGAQELRDEHMACRRRIYVESDPFAWQVRYVQGDSEAVAHLSAHDTHFSFGENLGADDCLVPLRKFKWMTTRQPVTLDLWKHDLPAGDAFTTVTTWKNKAKVIQFQDESYYWTKDVEFEKFMDVPMRCPAKFELATTVSADVRARLTDHGWRLADSVSISRSMDRYREYIQRSRGEFTVARDQYVRPRTGWSSDRSVCYLAAGRPVITQETGFSKHLPAGKGLFGFSTIDDIRAAVEDINRDYAGNCRAALEIADEYFDAKKVLASLMERAGL